MKACRPWGTHLLSAPLPSGVCLLPDPSPAALRASLATGFPLLLGVRGREDNGVATFRRCTRVGKAASLRRWLDICAAGVRGLRTWPRAFWPKRFSSLRLSFVTTLQGRFTFISHATRSWFPTPVLLGVPRFPRGRRDRPKTEATLYSELRTPSLPRTHVRVGDCWRNNR